VELETNALEIARKKGLDVEPLLLTDHQLNQQQFDIITMFGVMEHLVYPRRDMTLVQNMLDSEGIFMAITPNAQSLVGMLLHEKARFYTPRNHPLIFCMDSIQYLLENTGFEILHLDTVLTGYDSIVNFLQYREPFSDIDTSFLPQSIRQMVLNKSQCEQMILDWDLGLRLRVIARKK
jgi:predicted TPR repeat methyltransferase